MNPTIEINEKIDVAVTYRAGGDIVTLAYPHKMIHHGREVTFTKLGMRHPTFQGKRMVHIFDMSDGVNDYHLEFDAERLTWMLVSMIPGDANG